MEEKTKYQSIVIMGKIASGKGTQARAIQKQFGGAMFSIGNNVRNLAKEDDILGRKMKSMYETGRLIPEWIASYWMTKAILDDYPNDRLIFEAVARKPDEASLFVKIHEWVERPFIVFNLQISDEAVKERSQLRSRDIVDSEGSVETRLFEYRTYTEESIAIFREAGAVIDINGEDDAETVSKNIFKHLI